jgi:N6-L-threonylcarbamoyladenine synthase
MSDLSPKALPKLYLGIETSCDETAVAIVEDGRKLKAARLVSQIDLHRQFGGVVPEVAARRHLEAINQLVEIVLQEAQVDPRTLSGIACTTGPGLIGTLLVGLSCAKALAWSYDVPLIAVDHIHAHVCANYIDSDLEPPFVALVVSGGHTQIMHFKSYKEAEILGQTIDDASGEAYDKVARLLGLGYPGGPAIDKAAAQGNPRAFQLPEGVVAGYDFSFSGLKTAVMRTLENLKSSAEKSAPESPESSVEKDSYLEVYDLAASFQDAVNRVLYKKTMLAAQKLELNRIVLAGGVAANSDLRRRFEATAGFVVYRPDMALCTDNAAMVAAAAYYSGQPVPLSAAAYSRRC